MKSYRAFLLRCWREPGETQNAIENWRFLLMEIGIAPQTPRGFGDWAQLLRHLSGELAADPSLENQSPEPDENLLEENDHDRGGQ